jgi:hypothetical protein
MRNDPLVVTPGHCLSAFRQSIVRAPRTYHTMGTDVRMQLRR